MSLMDVLQNQCNKCDELEMATIFIGHRKEVGEALLQAKEEIAALVAGVAAMKEDLEIMRAQNDKCKDLSALLNDLNAKSIHMEEFLTTERMEELARLNNEASSFVPPADNECRTNANEIELSSLVESLSVDSTESGIWDCKKTLFKNVEDSYCMELLGADEFAEIPKYIIGRQTLNALNEFVTSLNQILEAKYTLLALGKNGARKKGKLDLYLSLKQDEIIVRPGEERIYFFTAEDYYRHTQTKLDKTKLNLLTALRHCKRMRELRSGKTLLYVVIPGGISG